MVKFLILDEVISMEGCDDDDDDYYNVADVNDDCNDNVYDGDDEFLCSFSMWVDNDNRTGNNSTALLNG